MKHENNFKLNTTKLFKWRHLFIETFSFLQSSLSNLVDNLLITSQDMFSISSKSLPIANKQRILQRKGGDPYKNIKSLDLFKETNLPPLVSSYKNITDNHISLDDYEHAQTVFKMFVVHTM